MSTRLLKPLPLKVLINLDRDPQVFSHHVGDYANRIRANKATIQVRSFKFRANRGTRNLHIALRSTGVTHSFNRHPLPIIPRQQVTGVVNRTDTISRVEVTTGRYTCLSASLNSFRHINRTNTDGVVNADGRGLTFHTRAPRNKQVCRPYTIALGDNANFKLQQFEYPALFVGNAMTLVTRRPFPVLHYFRDPDVNPCVNYHAILRRHN